MTAKGVNVPSSCLKDARFLRLVAAGSLLRLSLFALPRLCDALADRPEVSTPATSFKRLQEGLYLFDRGLDPYEGDLFQQSPLYLAFFRLLPKHRLPVAACYTLVDAAIAGLLYAIASKKNSKTTASPVQALAASAVYLLHPFSIANCIARSTLSFPTLFALSAVLLASQHRLIPAVCSLSIATHLGVYPLLLLPPLVMLGLSETGDSPVQPVATAIAFYVGHVVQLAIQSRGIVGSWSFGRTAVSLDLTPNVGLSWYLFIEMFDHFRTFFVGAFHLHVVSYVAPLCIKLRHDPLFASIIVLGIVATFKSYPSVGDVAVFHAMLSMYPEIYPHLRHPLLSASLLFYSACLLPAFHHLWLYAGSGNANFYYASTLVWSIGTGALVLDALFAYLRRDFALAQKVEGDASVVIVQE